MNAVKFNDKDDKLVEVRGSVVEGNFAAVEVIDNGPGIPPEEHKNLFHKFHQIDKYFTGQIEGVGLGLAVTKHIVELQGGKILVESALGKGSKFTVLLPIFNK
jgi:signal transduction histidine kinase